MLNNGRMSDDARRRLFVDVSEQLLRIVGKFETLHSRPHDFGIGAALYPAEVHTLQCVGDHPGLNLTALAQRQGVTKGAASQMVKKLEAKGLLTKATSKGNDKETVLALTSTGAKAREGHNRFHEAINEQVLARMGPINTDSFRHYAMINAIIEQFLDDLLSEHRRQQ